ncbi:MAG: hypothetical protein RLY16_1195 [Bacteroidota bacterium]|jgi:DNA-binding LytR/AlgR family response regulator
MKVLIFEDEEPAAKRLTKMLLEINPGIEILDCIVSIASGITWLQKNPAPDLIVSDIQLSDGCSFEIFKSVETTVPIIFTTAYDEYAIEAFSVNSIDYLLKPVKKENLEKAITKYQKQHAPAITPNQDLAKLLMHLNNNTSTQQFKKRFLVRYGEHIKVVNIEDVAYFYTEDKANFLTTKEGKRYIVDFNLDTLDAMLDPRIFFRINRQYIIGIHAIAEMFAYSKSRVLVKLQPASKHETIVSTERSADFKIWLGDEK